MKRKDFLRGLGIAGLGSVLPAGKSAAAPATLDKLLAPPPNCTLIPSETAGPYPLDLSGNSAMFRQDTREGRAGVQLNLKLRIIGAANCLPMPNCRVDIWHCDKDGYYSGYTTNAHNGTQNHVGETFCRGIQMTDANGEVNFICLFPGWYPGRITHIHFQVFLSSVLQVTSQLTFPVTEKNAIYVANPTIYGNASGGYGPDPVTFATDNVFADGYALQLATLTPNSMTGGYDSFLEVTINGSGTTGLQNLEPETGGQFKMGQNYPNPYRDATTIPFTLTYPSNVRIELWDLTGRKVGVVSQDNMAEGAQTITLNMKQLGLATGNYVYQIEVENSNGVFRQCKMMTGY